MEKQSRLNLWYFVAAFFGLLLVQGLWSQSGHESTIPYSEFESYLKDGKISEVVISSQYIRGTLKDSPQDSPQHVVATRVDPALASRLDQYGVKFSETVENTFLSNLLSWLIPIALFFGLWMFVFRRFAEKQGLGGMMSIGKSKAKVFVETDTKVGFDDVAGVDEAKGELQEIVDFLKDPTRHGRLGARMPKGILLVGPPGTGKTLLARAVAGEAGVPFFSIGGSEFVEMFVGVGAARVVEHAAAAHGGVGDERHEGGPQRRTELERARRLVGRGLRRGRDGLGHRGRRRRRFRRGARRRAVRQAGADGPASLLRGFRPLALDDEAGDRQRRLLFQQSAHDAPLRDRGLPSIGATVQTTPVCDQSARALPSREGRGVRLRGIVARIAAGGARV